MMTANRSSFKLSVIALTLAISSAFGIRTWAQESPDSATGKAKVSGLADDWTHHHLIFSNPGTEEEAIRKGTHERWLKTANDPRYIMQQLKKSQPTKRVADEEIRETVSSISTKKDPKATKTKIKKDWSESLGSTTAPSNVVYPAKWSFSTSGASCANDFVVYPTGQAGASNRATIIAYYNLYSGCTSFGTVPAVDWAYNTGTGSIAGLSPVFSFNGNQVAFIQTSGGVASLVLLTFPITPPGTGTLTSPATNLTSKTPLTYYGCAAPCMTSIAFSGGTTDTQSNPYYDYLTDSLYVGDSVGKLHKFNPVFNGTPAEVTTNWPVQLKTTVNDTNQVASPVYDISSGYVFVGTTSLITSTGGVLYSVGTGNQSTTSGSIHGYSGELDELYGILDAPIVDSTAGKVYVFAGENPSGKNAVYQFATNFTSGSGTAATLGTGGTGTTTYQFDGAFDNNYYTSSNGSSPSGHLYVCGTAGSAPLYQVAINSNAMGTVVTGPTLSSSSYYGRCSPVTEFFNTTGAAAATQTGTFTGAPVGTQTASITNGSNVLTLTISTGTDTVAFNSEPANQSTFVIGATGGTSTTYEFATSGIYCTTGDHCIQRSTSASTNASRFAAAVGGSCYTNSCTADPNVSASYPGSGTVVTLTVTSGKTITLTNNTGTAITLGSTSFSPATTSGCSSTTTATVAPSTNTTTLATNLAAVITACDSTYPAVGVTASSSGAVVTVTADTAGTAGNSIALGETLTNFSWAGSTLTGGSDGNDYIFLSVFSGTESGCTNGTTDGCVMSFDVTTPSSFSSSSTPSGTQNLSAVEYGSPTGGIIVDNGVSAPAGASQIYFETQSNTGTSPCTGICAVQASQTAP